MNKSEMRELLLEHLARYRTRAYSELVPFVKSKQVDSFEVKGIGGAPYQIHVQFFWDGKPSGDIRVAGSVDDSPHRPLFGFIPIYISSVTEDFILSPKGIFVGE